MQLYYRGILLGLVLLSIVGCQKQNDIDYDQRTSYFNNIVASHGSDSIITCVTYNIQLGFKAYKDPWSLEDFGAGSDQIENLAAIIEQADPDIIALQEVPRNRANAIIKDFLEQLAIRLRMNYAFGAHGYNDPYGVEPVYGEWGNAILTKYHIEDISNHEVEYVDRWERRSMLDAELRINDSITLSALSLHHLSSPEGIPNTAEYVKRIDGPIVLMGDFNYVGEIETFTDIGLKDVDSTYTNHGVDRLFVRSTTEVVEIGSLIDTIQTSDHPANYAVLQLVK